jgi:hypothetical protein
MKLSLVMIALLNYVVTYAQVAVDLTGFNKAGSSAVSLRANSIEVTWATGNNEKGILDINLEKGKPLFHLVKLSNNGAIREIARDLDPSFVVTIGKRDLVSQNGWNIFFDRVPLKPFQAYVATLDKSSASVASEGSRTIITVGSISADRFSGNLQITLYSGSALLNIAAVMSTDVDSTAVVYDAGLVSKSFKWQKLVWSDPLDKMQATLTAGQQAGTPLAVKYRTIIGVGKEGSLALFPPPHQYFYPLDECFNLKFTWYGSNYRNMVEGYGIGIRQDLYGDKRYVPWFNAPPGTKQRMNFFCLLSTETKGGVLEDVKQYTHGDSYLPLPGYKTMGSHFHIEHTSAVLGGKPMPDTPNFVRVFRKAGLNIIHLAEFHGPGHPKGPEEQRFPELKTLFSECRRLSGKNFLLLPGEEPNNFFGGHWLEFFPKPVFWMMSRKPGEAFVSTDANFGKVYRVSDKTEMLKLLELENGLAWTAHARTKGSTGFPDQYKDETFYQSDHFFGAAWKAMPADLSLPKLGLRVLDLMDDMANWGMRKHVLAEADLFQIEPDFELYAHMNVNYMQLDTLPSFEEGWQPVLDVMKQGKFFVSTGEVLLPSFSVNGKRAGETLPAGNGQVEVKAEAIWTFPLNYAEIISGDGKQVYRQHIDLRDTKAFGKKSFVFNADLKGRKWVRFEIWDAAANGAFTQCVWLD